MSEDLSRYKGKYLIVLTFNNKGLADRFLHDTKIPQSKMELDRTNGKMKVTFVSDTPVKEGDYTKSKLGLKIESAIIV